MQTDFSVRTTKTKLLENKYNHRSQLTKENENEQKKKIQQMMMMMLTIATESTSFVN